MPIIPIMQQASAVSTKSTAYEGSVQSTDANAKGTAGVEQIKAIPKQDNFTKSETSKDVIYPKPKGLTADELRDISEQRISAFKKMISSMIGNQAQNFKFSEIELNKNTIENLDLSKANLEKLSKEFSEDKDWGVDAIATKIMDMATSLSGGDPEKIEVLRAAVQKGFDAAGTAWGGELPDISKKTLDEIMTRFDYWKDNGSLEDYKMNADQAGKNASKIKN